MGRGLSVQAQKVPVQFHLQLRAADAGLGHGLPEQGGQVGAQAVVCQQAVKTGHAAFGGILLQQLTGLTEKLPSGHAVVSVIQLSHGGAHHGLEIEEQVGTVEAAVVQAAEPLDGALLILRQTAQGFCAKAVECIVGRHKITSKSSCFYGSHSIA